MLANVGKPRLSKSVIVGAALTSRERSCSMPSIAEKKSRRKKRRRPRHTDERNDRFRKQIVDVARSMFLEQGYEGVSMRKIASRIPCATGTLYLYFPDKVSILMHIWEELFEASFNQCFEAASRHRKSLKKIHAFCTEYIHYWVDHPDHFHMIWLLDERDKTGKKYVQTTRSLSKYDDWIYGIVQEALDKGEIEPRGMSATDIGNTMFAISHGVATHIVCHSDMDWNESKKFAEYSVDCVLRGLSVG